MADSVKKLLSFDAQVLSFMRNYLAKTGYGKLCRRIHGNEDEIIQMACLQLLQNPPSDATISWTTYAANAVRYAALMFISREARQLRSANAQGVCSHYDTFEELELGLDFKEFKERIFKCADRYGNTEVVRMFLEGVSVKDIAFHVHLAQERIWQLLERAFRESMKTEFSNFTKLAPKRFLKKQGLLHESDARKTRQRR